LKGLEEATAARACLKQFWARFQDLWTHKLKEAKVSQRLIDEDIQLMSATSTTRHQQGLESEKQNIQAEIKAQRDKAKNTASVKVQVSGARRTKARKIFLTDQDARSLIRQSQFMSARLR
jgi:hypothetical protein